MNRCLGIQDRTAVAVSLREENYKCRFANASNSSILSTYGRCSFLEFLFVVWQLSVLFADRNLPRYIRTSTQFASSYLFARTRYRPCETTKRPVCYQLLRVTERLKEGCATVIDHSVAAFTRLCTEMPRQWNSSNDRQKTTLEESEKKERKKNFIRTLHIWQMY